MKEVADKNQYPEILPFDYNRVVLSRSPTDPYSHYINASYVNVCLAAAVAASIIISFRAGFANVPTLLRRLLKLKRLTSIFGEWCGI